MTKTEYALLASLAKSAGSGHFHNAIDRMLSKAKTRPEKAEILAINDRVVKTNRFLKIEHRHTTHRKSR